MSLVAYEFSDDENSDEGEETEIVTNISVSDKSKSANKTSNGKADEEFFTLNGEKSEEAAEDHSSSNKSSLFPSLPAPKSKAVSIDVDWVDKTSKTKSQPVKILIPSLSELQEEEPEEPVKKKIKPSAKGSGLFALLPKPKSEASSIKLVPPSVKKSTPLIPKQVAKTVNAAPVVPKPVEKLNVGYDDSDDEGVEVEKSTDFFSLTEKPDDKNIPLVETPDVSLTSTTSDYNAPSASYPQPGYEQSYYPQQSSEATASSNDYLQFQSNPVQQNQSEDYIPFNSSEIDLDENALRQLCGRKDRKAISGQILDVHGDNLVMNSHEWLLQSISEEKVQTSHKKNKKDGPSTTEKRKHQITFLAHQAKENELELKNTWANNRQTRKQTQAKYGF